MPRFRTGTEVFGYITFRLFSQVLVKKADQTTGFWGAVDEKV